MDAVGQHSEVPGLMQLGACSCGAIHFEVELPQALSAYNPRACDCDFCVQRGVRYLSDPQGSLTIHATGDIEVLTQGSGRARFLQCASCHDLIAATFGPRKSLRGAVNATLLEAAGELPAAQVVSPKQLSADEKEERWKRLWMNVRLEGSISACFEQCE